MSRNLNIWVILVAALFTSASPIQSKEPSEQEIRAAVERDFELPRTQIIEFAKICSTPPEIPDRSENKRFSGNNDKFGPFFGNRGFNLLICNFYPDLENIEDVRISNLKKIACEKAVGYPGYNCDFLVNIDFEKTESDSSQNDERNRLFFAGMTVDLEKTLKTELIDPNTSRFVFDGNNWIMITRLMNMYEFTRPGNNR